MFAAERGNTVICIGHQILNPEQYREFISSPWVAERIVGPGAVQLVCVMAGAADLPGPGSLPVVIAAITQDPSLRLQWSDLTIGEAEVDELARRVGENPLAATSLATLLRAQASLTVDQGLAAESAVYAMLQAGPEFARWRAANDDLGEQHDHQPVLVRRDGEEMTITLNRPDRHNALSTQMRGALTEALTLATVDSSIELVRLDGNGPSFCAGGDLAEFGLRPDPATAHVTRLALSPGRLIHQLANRVECQLHGHALGSGVEMASFAGRVVATSDASIGLPEVALGLIPGAGGTVSLTRRSGRHVVARLALLGERLNAKQAQHVGLVDHIAG